MTTDIAGLTGIRVQPLYHRNILLNSCLCNKKYVITMLVKDITAENQRNILFLYFDLVSFYKCRSSSFVFRRL